MRIEILADLHGPYWQPQQGIDAVITLGDIPNATLATIRDHYRCPILAVKGNHDSPGFPAGIIDLHLQVIQLGVLKIGGFQGSWRYKPAGHFLYDQHEVDLSTFPRVDVFAAHNSPRGIHDREDEVHPGFSAFNAYIARVSPRIFLHGHQHENTATIIGQTQCRGIYGQQSLEI